MVATQLHPNTTPGTGLDTKLPLVHKHNQPMTNYDQPSTTSNFTVAPETYVRRMKGNIQNTITKREKRRRKRLAKRSSDRRIHLLKLRLSGLTCKECTTIMNLSHNSVWEHWRTIRQFFNGATDVAIGVLATKNRSWKKKL